MYEMLKPANGDNVMSPPRIFECILRFEVGKESIEDDDR